MNRQQRRHNSGADEKVIVRDRSNPAGGGVSRRNVDWRIRDWLHLLEVCHRQLKAASSR